MRRLVLPRGEHGAGPRDRADPSVAPLLCRRLVGPALSRGAHALSPTAVALRCSDDALVARLGRGARAAARELRRRHHAAVYAYAVSCTSDPYDAYDLTDMAFARLSQSASFYAQWTLGRHRGCLRRQLQEWVRTAAVARIQDDSASLAPGFRAWVNDGGRWPLEHDGQLATAFKLQPAASQCLLWHAAVERDDAVSITRITGHPYRHLGELGDKARDSLRRTRMDVYLQRLERRPCRYAIGSLVAHGRVTSSPLMRPSPHFVDCLSCREVYYDVVDLDRRLQQRLPRSTLGWWPAEEYLRIKWATSPLRDPPAAAPRPAPGRHRKPARLPARLLPAGVLDGLATSLDGLATRKGTR